MISSCYYFHGLHNSPVAASERLPKQICAVWSRDVFASPCDAAHGRAAPLENTEALLSTSADCCPTRDPTCSPAGLVLIKSWQAPPVRDHLPEGASPPAYLKLVFDAPLHCPAPCCEVALPVLFRNILSCTEGVSLRQKDRNKNTQVRLMQKPCVGTACVRD